MAAPSPEPPEVGGTTAPPHRRRWAWVAVAVLVALALVGVALEGNLLSRSGTAPTPLVVRVVSDPAASYAPANVELTAEVSGGQGPYTYTWTQGATVLGRATQILVTYNSPGNESVLLTVVDSAGTTASARALVQVVSTVPTAAAFVPASSTVETVLLTIRWHAPSPVSTCVLESWGILDVPRYAQCAGAGGIVVQGTGNAITFEPDPDDPEVTPVLFQSAAPGIGISVAWWYNTTSSSEAHGTAGVTTAVLPL